MLRAIGRLITAQQSLDPDALIAEIRELVMEQPAADLSPVLERLEQLSEELRPVTQWDVEVVRDPVSGLATHMKATSYRD